MFFDEQITTVRASAVARMTIDGTVWLPDSNVQVLTLKRVGRTRHFRLIGFDFDSFCAVDLTVPAAAQLVVLE